MARFGILKTKVAADLEKSMPIWRIANKKLPRRIRLKVQVYYMGSYTMG